MIASISNHGTSKIELGQTVLVRFIDDAIRVSTHREWLKKREEWRKNEIPARHAMRAFEQLYELYGRIEAKVNVSISSSATEF